MHPEKERGFDWLGNDTTKPPWESFYSLTWWKQIPGDSIEVVFYDHWEKWVLHLSRSGDSLTGQARFRSDAGPGSPPLAADVVARRISCVD
jgi:hypothetical protein